MKTISNLYAPGTVHAKRIDTDALFIDDDAVCRFTGLLDRTARYIADFQLMDPVHWARFVNQFKIHSDNDGAWRGEYWGKMMRGAAFTYAYLRDPALYQAMTDTVEDMLTAIDDQGRISTCSVAHEFRGWDIWCRKYVLLGMQYFLEVCTDDDLKSRILASMMRQVDYIRSKIGPKSEGKTPITEATRNWRGMNSSSLLEPVVRLYDLTGERRFLDFAQYIVDEGGTSIENVFELAYKNTTDPYQFPITKAYETISCFEGLLEYYRATGIEKYRQAVVNFARRIMQTDVTIIGSCGCTHELFDHSTARQTERYEGVMQETCVTVTWMKFCTQLLALTGDPAFADCIEQSLYNAYLGAVNTEKIVDRDLILKRYPDAVLEPLPFDSYSALLPGTRGRGIGGLQQMPDKHYYGCCACIGAAGIGLIGKMSILRSHSGVALNLYIPGTIETRTPSGQPLTLRIETAYPADGRIAVSLALAQPESFDLALRIPAWSEQNALTVNGEAAHVTPGYTTLTRAWHTGDTIVLTLDMRARVIHPIRYGRDVIFNRNCWQYDYLLPNVVDESPESKYHIALRRGPLTLARDARLDGTVDEAVDIAYDVDGVVALEPSAQPGFDTQVTYRVPQRNGSSFTVIDYASAGKTWDETSKYGCWLPTREYWRK